jgi:hypothetical protein
MGIKGIIFHYNIYIKLALQVPIKIGRSADAMVQKTYSVGGLGGSRYTAMAILMRYMMTVGF